MHHSTPAPSERHLETWIIQNNPFGFAGQILGSQIRVPSGVIDVLLSKPQGLTVVELKKGSLTTETLAQVLRYMADLKGIFRAVLCQLLDRKLITLDEFLFSFSVEHQIGGLLVGHSVPDRNLLIAAEACNVTVMRYRYVNDQYSFEVVSNPGLQLRDLEYDAYQNSPLLSSLKDLVFARLTE